MLPNRLEILKSSYDVAFKQDGVRAPILVSKIALIMLLGIRLVSTVQTDLMVNVMHFTFLSPMEYSSHYLI